jgi:hypothetical protein
VSNGIEGVCAIGVDIGETLGWSLRTSASDGGLVNDDVFVGRMLRIPEGAPLKDILGSSVATCGGMTINFDDGALLG